MPYARGHRALLCCSCSVDGEMPAANNAKQGYVWDAGYGTGAAEKELGEIGCAPIKRDGLSRFGK